MSINSYSNQSIAGSKLLNPERLMSDEKNDSQMANLVFSFLRRDEVMELPSVHRSWQPHFKVNSNLLWKSLYLEQLLPGIEKEELPTTDYRRAYTESYSKVISSDFYWDRFRARAWPKEPVPKDLRGQNLVFHPKYLSISQQELPFGLDEKGALISPSPHVSSDPKEEIIELVIPNTPFNISKLVEWGVVKGHPTGFSSFSWKNILVQHGNKKESSHWTAPNDRLIALGKSFSEQESSAQNIGLKLETFADTSLFYLLSFVRSGRWPCGDRKAARTSTILLGNGNNPTTFQVSLFTEQYDTGSRLTLFGNSAIHKHIGGAVGSSSS